MSVTPDIGEVVTVTTYLHNGEQARVMRVERSRGRHPHSGRIFVWLDPIDGSLVGARGSRELADELADWSAPVQIRIENGYVILRNLAQPVKGVYIVDDDRLENRA